MPADLTLRRRRRTGAAAVLAVGALLVTAGSAVAQVPPTPVSDDDMAMATRSTPRACMAPGHGFTLVRQDDWQGAVGSAILSHLGFHAPLLLTNRAKTLPTALDGYFKEVAPAFLISPADGPYNMTYIIGDYSMISWKQQTQIDHDSGMTNRRDPAQTTGGTYQPPM